MTSAIYNKLQPYEPLFEAGLLTAAGLYYSSLFFLKRYVHKKDEEQLKHLAADIALTPIRLSLLYLSYPVLLQCVDSEAPWNSDHSSMTLAAWSVLSLGYLFEMSVTQASPLSFLHHGIALAFTACSSAICHDDRSCHALMLRYMACELFFAIGLGGPITTATRLIYLSISANGNRISNLQRYSISALTWTLTVVISCGWTIKAIFAHVYSREFYCYFGRLCPLVMVGIGLIYCIQYWWIFAWAAKADRLSQKCGKISNINGLFRGLPLKVVFGLITLGLVDLLRIYIKYCWLE